MRLRVHHLFCSALYAGKGYSEGFCENMQRVVRWLWESPPQEKEERKVMLVTGPDNVCGGCPNLTAEGCGLEDNQVVCKDARLAQALRLEPEKVYTVSGLLVKVSGNLTREIFETSCKNCDWYRMGLCHYEKLEQKYHDIFLDIY